VLESLGWRIHRIWSTDWWLNPEGEVKKILEKLQALMAETAQTEDECSEVAATKDVPDGIEQPSAQENIEPLEPIATTLPVYVPVTLSVRGPDAFYEFRTGQLLTEQMAQVIDGEGPVSEALLFRKVARAWGLERTGSRIVERLKALAPASASKSYEDSRTFYWPKSVPHTSFSHFRIADNTASSKRHIDEVCLEEISAIVLQVLQQAGSAPHQDVARSVCHLVGMSTATAPAVARVVLAIRSLREMLKIIETDGNIRLPN
jgi:hypothetical protein